MIDRRLNYGRHLVTKFSKELISIKKTVDLGAGKGTDLLNCMPHLQESEFYGLEWNEDNITFLENKGIKVFQSDLEKDKLPFKDGEVDLIIMNQIFEHLKEIFWVFHEVTRILPIGGNIIIGFPNLASLHNRILLSLGKQPSSMQTFSAHIRGATKNDFINFLNKCFPAGYEVVEHAGSNFYPFPPSIAKPLASAFPSMAYGTFLLLKKVKVYDKEFIEFPVKNRLETNFFVG